MFSSILPARKCFLPPAETSPLPDFADGWCTPEQVEAMGEKFMHLVGEYVALDPAPGEETLRLSYLFGRELTPIARFVDWCSDSHPSPAVRRAALAVRRNIGGVKNLNEICAESADVAGDWGGEERRYIEYLGATHRLGTIRQKTFELRAGYRKHLEAADARLEDSRLAKAPDSADSDTRRREVTAARSRGDSELFAKILAVRADERFVDEVARISMLSPEQAAEFVSALAEATTVPYRLEMARLGAFAEVNGMESNLRHTDVAGVVREKNRQEQAARSPGKVNPHYTKRPGVWVEEAMARGAEMFQLDVERVEAGEMIGYKIAGDPGGFIYFDLARREGKQDHPMTVLLTGGCRAGPPGDFAGFDRGARPHVVVVSMGVPMDAPMTPNHVQAIYHEIGHALHQVLSRPRLFMLGGFSAETDFIEAPAIFMERQSPFVQGAPGYSLRMSVMRALFDLRAHRLPAPTPEGLAGLWYEVESKVFGETVAAEDRGHEYSDFGHMLEGYGSRYYGYLSGRVLAAGFAAATGDDFMRFRREVLEPGATRPALETVRAFMGAGPDPLPEAVKIYVEESFPGVAPLPSFL